MDIQKTIKNLQARGFIVKYFDAKEDASNYLNNSIKDTTVGIGGSITVDQMGLYDSLTASGNTVYWHWRTPGIDTLNNANNAPVYISSANAISEDGEILNIDGNGNRINATSFGKKTVYIVAGTNKIAGSLSDAIERARNIAAPQNIKRLNCKTPCVTDDKCHDCKSVDRICREMLIMMAPVKNMSVEVILIGEELGY